MASTTILFPGLPPGISSCRVRRTSDLAILETVALTNEGDHYSGTVSGSHAGHFLFEALVGSVVIDSQVAEIADDAGPHVILHVPDLEPRLNYIRDQVAGIGQVTFLATGSIPDSDGAIRIKAGDRHAFTFTADANSADIVPDLTGVTIRFGIRGNGGVQLLETNNVQIIAATGQQSVSVTLLPAETILLPTGGYHYDLQAEYTANDHRTFFTGSVNVIRDYSGVPNA